MINSKYYRYIHFRAPGSSIYFNLSFTSAHLVTIDSGSKFASPQTLRHFIGDEVLIDVNVMSKKIPSGIWDSSGILGISTHGIGY